MLWHRTIAFFLVLLLASRVSTMAQTSAKTDFAGVQALFTKHCLDCHSVNDPESNLVLENFETLLKGSENGPVIAPGKSGDSLLVKMIEGRIERDGKKIIMPPGKRKKLQPEEITAIKAWIDAGSLPPSQPAAVREVSVPKIAPRVPPKIGVTSLAYSAGARLLAVGKFRTVELRSATSRAPVRVLEGHRGNINAVAFSSNGMHLFAASGENSVVGEVRQWKVSDGTLVGTFEGHKDTIYSLALSPDGKTLATGSYDQKIKLWSVEDGTEIRTLNGHNGAVFGLAFRPDGKILASASADRTVKLWNVETGERRDTLAQSLKELFTVAFSPDGKRLAAAGVDNRIRVWTISEEAKETTNPILFSHFAHEGAILKIVFSVDGRLLLSSADDRTVKLWDAREMEEKFSLETQPDWAPALAFTDKNNFVVGRLDGSLGYYNSNDGKTLPAPKPELARLEPRGAQRGIASKIKLVGTNLFALTGVSVQNDKFKASVLSGASENGSEAWIEVSPAADLPRGAYDISARSADAESGKLKLYVDDLPQLEVMPGSVLKAAGLPASAWGKMEKAGATDKIEFQARAGQTIVFDLAAKSVGSKLNGVLTLFDAGGKVLASNNSFDGSDDAVIAHTFSSDGRFMIQVNDLMLGASQDHFYRLSLGQLPTVVAYYPLSVPANSESEIELIGFNLPADHRVKIKSGDPTEPNAMPRAARPAKGRAAAAPKKMDAAAVSENGLKIPVPEEFRARKIFKIMVGPGPEAVETEPNDAPGQAMKIEVPGAVNGRFFKPKNDSDTDYFRFEARAGENFVIETMAGQLGSPADTKVEVLWPDGKPVQRLLLQAVRDSAITFRPIDSSSSDARVDNWQEMELNEYLYMQGEVARIFRMPQGPDSGFLFYSSAGKRRAYFDTSSTTHPLDEPCYIVEPHPPGTKFVANGLPVFPLYYVNDDDAERKLGSDSRLHFTAPKDGEYVVRVSDSRGFGGERYAYRLVVRPAKPDFKVTLNQANKTINAGSGQEFSVTTERLDEFDNDIIVEIKDLPPGFSASTPLVIQAGHAEAKGTIHVAADAPKPGDDDWTKVKVTATASIAGENVTKDVNNFGKLMVGEKPKLFVAFEPMPDQIVKTSATNSTSSGSSEKPFEIWISPGQTVPAVLKVQRNGHMDLVTFTVENLPHGVIVDNIGLNGVLIPKDQNERQIFLAAAKWVPDLDRLCFAIENQAGKQTSRPVLLHVRKNLAAKQAAAK